MNECTQKACGMIVNGETEVLGGEEKKTCTSVTLFTEKRIWFLTLKQVVHIVTTAL